MFLATPKTGTTAIETALESKAALAVLHPPPLKQTSVRLYQKFLRGYLEEAAGGSFAVVALIRETQDWLGSWYRTRQRPGVVTREQCTEDVSFEEFVRADCQAETPEFVNVGTQADFLHPRNGNWVNRLFRYEDIDSFVDYLEQALRCEIVLPRLNVSPKVSLDVSAEARDLLQSFAAKDYALYRTLQHGKA